MPPYFFLLQPRFSDNNSQLLDANHASMLKPTSSTGQSPGYCSVNYNDVYMISLMTLVLTIAIIAPQYAILYDL